MPFHHLSHTPSPSAPLQSYTTENQQLNCLRVHRAVHPCKVILLIVNDLTNERCTRFWRPTSPPSRGTKRGCRPLGGSRGAAGGRTGGSRRSLRLRAQRKNKEARSSFDDRASKERRLPTLPTGGSVPSAMVSLTSLFGMGRGGSSPL